MRKKQFQEYRNEQRKLFPSNDTEGKIKNLPQSRIPKIKTEVESEAFQKTTKSKNATEHVQLKERGKMFSVDKYYYGTGTINQFNK